MVVGRNDLDLATDPSVHFGVPTELFSKLQKAAERCRQLARLVDDLSVTEELLLIAATLDALDGASALNRAATRH